MGKLVAHLIRLAVCLLLESQLLIGFSLLCVFLESWLLISWCFLLVCYGKVGCSSDWICYLCVMEKSVAHLISFTACVLLERRMLIGLDLLHVCYEKVDCSFDLVRVCVLWESWLLI